MANVIIGQHIPGLTLVRLAIKLYIERTLVRVAEPFFDLIQEAAKYNEHVGEWQLKCIAYTGNNISEVRRADGKKATPDI